MAATWWNATALEHRTGELIHTAVEAATGGAEGKPEAAATERRMETQAAVDIATEMEWRANVEQGRQSARMSGSAEIGARERAIVAITETKKSNEWFTTERRRKSGVGR